MCWHVDYESKKSKNSVTYKKKSFSRKSNSLKVFHKETKKSTRTLKNVLSEKNMNTMSKKTKSTISSKKEKKKTASKYNSGSIKIKNNSKKSDNKENGTMTKSDC